MDYSEKDLQNLYDQLKPFVWKLYFEEEEDDPKTNSTLTAFAVRPGLLMTCAHGAWLGYNKLLISAKPLTGGGLFAGNVVAQKPNCEMVLVRIADVGEMELGRFGSGKLEVGETIMTLGHPWHFLASGMVGRNVYPCVDDPEFNLNDDRTCLEHYVDPVVDPAKYRIMGDVWNLDIFTWARNDRKNSRNLRFEENLLTHCPIIQAAGIIGGPGSSGAPVCNLKGEIVGMHVYGIKGFEFSIHVAALNAFLGDYLAKVDTGGGSLGDKAAGPSEKSKKPSQKKMRRS